MGKLLVSGRAIESFSLTFPIRAPSSTLCARKLRGGLSTPAIGSDLNSHEPFHIIGGWETQPNSRGL